MNNQKNNEGLPDLYMMKDKTVEEISECSEGLDEAAKKRILKLCEKKLGISEHTDENKKIEKTAEVKNYTKPKWYSAAIAAAACVIVVTGMVIVGNNIKTSDPDIKDPVVTSQSETTQTSVSQSQTTKNTETYKPVSSDVEEYRKIVDEMVLKYEEVDNVLTDSGEKRAVTDYSDSYSVNGMTYYKVSDPRFSAKQDIYTFVETVYTKQDVEKNKSLSIESKFSEKDGKLYIMPQEYGKGWLFDGWSDIPAEISDISDDIFTAVKKYNVPGGQTDHIKFRFIKENNEWRIMEATFDNEAQTNNDNNNQVNNESTDYNFNLNIGKISAKDVYECSQPYKMPETINSCAYSVKDIINKEKVYVILFLESGERQVGIYDFQTDSYSEIVNIAQNDFVIKYSEDYLIIQNNDDVEEWGDNTPSLSYYNINTKTSGIIYEDMISTNNDVLIYNNVLYFDVYTRFETISDKESCVYKYNLLNGELTLVRENALMPVIINNNVAALITNPATGSEDTLQIIEGNDNYRCNIEKDPAGIYVKDNTLFELYSDSTYCATIKNLKSGEKVLSNYPGSMCNIEISDSNNNFIAFSKSSIDQLPCMYDMNLNKLVEFDNIQKTHCDIYVKDDYGIINCLYYDTASMNDEPLKSKEIILFQSQNK